MRADYAQAILDRMAVTASNVGISTGDAGCQPNVVVYISATPDALAVALTQDAELVSSQSVHGNTRGREALGDFRTSDQPVRWWHVSQTSVADGSSTQDDLNIADSRATPLNPGASSSVPETGRLRSSVREDLSRAIIIVDATRIQGASIVGLADYLAMVSLAQLDPTATPSGAPTILSLFSGGAQQTLSEWDIAYLEALYATPPNARSSDAQEEDIARRMAANLGD